MLSREKLTDDQWNTVRNTPHHVVIAVSAVGGSIFDEMLERAAAMEGIVEALNSRHPLLRGIAASRDIMDAQDQVRAWYHGLADSDRNLASLQAKAVASLKEAIAVLNACGGTEDVRHYGDFVIALATRVARSAREGDLFGVGGELVSTNERVFLELLEVTIDDGRR